MYVNYCSWTTLYLLVLCWLTCGTPLGISGRWSGGNRNPFSLWVKSNFALSASTGNFWALALYFQGKFMLLFTNQLTFRANTFCLFVRCLPICLQPGRLTKGWKKVGNIVFVSSVTLVGLLCSSYPAISWYELLWSRSIQGILNLCKNYCFSHCLLDVYNIWTQ